MEIRFHVILLIACSVLFACSWRWLRLNSPITLTLALCMVIATAKLILLAWVLSMRRICSANRFAKGEAPRCTEGASQLALCKSVQHHPGRNQSHVESERRVGLIR